MKTFMLGLLMSVVMCLGCSKSPDTKAEPEKTPCKCCKCEGCKPKKCCEESK